MKAITPLRLRESYFSGIEEEINKIFWEEIYAPLIKVMGLPRAEVLNSKDPLVDAVASGRVWFEDGKFFGSYDAQISLRLQQIGARFNSRTKTWSYSGPLPAEISIATVRATERYSALRDSMLYSLDKAKIGSIERLQKLTDKYDQTIRWMDNDFLKTVKAIAIVPKISAVQKERIASEWANNLDLYISDWSEQNIKKLRRSVQTNVFAGRRASDLVSMIQQNYAVSKHKAKFLARQETSLLMSKYRETRYTEIGADKYKWSGAMDDRERPDHKRLQGKIFSWSDPPVVNLKTGDTGHPGEDFGCRCVAVALIE